MPVLGGLFFDDDPSVVFSCFTLITEFCVSSFKLARLWLVQSPFGYLTSAKFERFLD